MLDNNLLARLVIPVWVAWLALTPSVNVSILMWTFGGSVRPSDLVVAANTHAFGVVSIIEVWACSNRDAGSALPILNISHLCCALWWKIRELTACKIRNFRNLKICLILISRFVWLRDHWCVYSEAEFWLSILNSSLIKAFNWITVLHVKDIVLHFYLSRS